MFICIYGYMYMYFRKCYPLPMSWLAVHLVGKSHSAVPSQDALAEREARAPESYYRDFEPGQGLL